MTKPTTLGDIAAMMAKGFAAVAGDISHIRENMATKADIAALDGKIDAVRDELKADIATVRADIRSIRSNLDNIKGFRVEIDHALELIAAIEKHLGIKHEIAA